MKAVLNVIIAAAVIAVAGAASVEQVGKFLEELYAEENGEATLIPADGDFDINVVKGMDQNEDEDDSDSVESSNLGSDSEKESDCKPEIMAHDGKVACGLSYFKLDEYSYNDKSLKSLRVVVLLLGFKYKSYSQDYFVNVPFIPVPSEYASDKAGLEGWAKDNGVSLNSPIDSKKLTDLENNIETSINFKWFAELLKKGVLIIDDDLVYSHPIALPADVHEKLVKLYDNFEDPFIISS